MFHVELVPLGGIFGPLKSDLEVFWPFPGTGLIMEIFENLGYLLRLSAPDFKTYIFGILFQFAKIWHQQKRWVFFSI